MVKKIKKKNKISKIIRIIIPILIITILFISKNIIYKNYLYITSEYNNKTIDVFLEDNTYENIKNHKYSKTLDKIANTKYYNYQYIQEYIAINYQEKDNFLENITTFLSLGYNSNDINTFYQLNDDSINTILEYEYIKNLTDIINIKYFKEENLNRYIKYQNKNKKDIETTVTYVNIGLDNNYYTKINNVKKQDDILVLVNKYNSLSKNYIPKDLTYINSKYGNGQLRKEAKDAFEKMCENALKDNIKIYSGSAYRSYDYQNNLYNNYVALDGKTVADTYAARPGHSEHQTGLAIDILNANWDYISKNDKEYIWLINNSYKYGFILRYPKGKENITGYMYEEWHFRYLGTETAKILHDLNITYDEYIAQNY